MNSRKYKEKPLTCEEKFIVSKIIAQNYMKGGQFGYKKGKDLIQEQLKYKIPAATYNNCLTTIVRMGIRELEEFLKRNTKMNVKFINHQQQGVIRTPLLRCREWMSQAHIETFFKLISNHYQLKTASITKNDAISLYKQIYSLIDNYQQKQEIMYQKRISKQNTLRFSKNKSQQRNQSQKQRVFSRDEPQQQQQQQFKIKSEYFFQTEGKEKVVKEAVAEIDYDKFQGDLGLCHKQQSKQEKNS